MTSKTYSHSFAAGQLSPELFGRLDLTKNQTGLQTALNFETMAHGPARNRAGFGYVLHAKFNNSKSVMIPFSFSTTQTYALEFGVQYMRIHTQGGTVLENNINITGITQANPAVVTAPAHGYVTGQTVWLNSIGGMIQLNTRFVNVTVIDANTFSINSLSGVTINSTAYNAYTAGGTTARVYEIVTPYLEADLGDLHYEQSADVMTLTMTGYQQRELRRLGATNWTLTTLSFAPTIAAPLAPGLATGGAGGGTPVNNIYMTTAVSSSLEESVSSPTTTQSYDLTVAGNFIDVNPKPGGIGVTGAIRYNIYKQISGIWGYIGQTDGSVLRDKNITPDATKTPPIVNDPFPSVNNWPATVGYAGQRRIFGQTLTMPQNIWATQAATESNMTYSIPSRASDAVFVRIATRDSQLIRHIIQLADLIILTNSGVWRIQSDATSPLSPTNVDPRLQTAIGASNVRPMVVGRSLIYAEDSGGRIRETTYAWQLQGYDSRDLSLLAPNLFDGFAHVSAAYTRIPVPIIWYVRNDGALLGCTYMVEQDVAGWHVHNTGATGADKFESVCSVKENGEDVLYAVVNRTINGQQVRYIERKHTRNFTDPKDAFFVDSGLTYNATPAQIISGLWHLEGMTVNIIADGATHPPRVVTGGTITLQGNFSKVQIGLPIIADFQTLPLGLQLPAMGGGIQKNVNNASLRMVNTSGILVGPNFNKLRPMKQRTSEPYGTAAALMNREQLMPIDPTWGQDAQVCVRQVEPQPVTITAITLEIATG